VSIAEAHGQSFHGESRGVPDSGAPLLHAQCWGNGPTVIFVHGWLHSSDVWAEVAQHLAGKYRCIALDLPGFGQSAPLPAGRATFSAYSDILAQTLTALPASQKPVGIVADSLGAILALRLWPERCVPGAAVILSGCPFLGLSRVFGVLATTHSLGLMLRLLHLTPMVVSRTAVAIGSLATLKRLSAGATTLLHRAALDADPAAAEQLFLEVCQVPQGLTQDRIPGSTLMRGEFDRVATRRTVKPAAEALGAHYVELEGAGHTPMLECPARFAVEIDRSIVRVCVDGGRSTGSTMTSEATP